MSSLLSNCNHKVLGLYYLWFALLFGLIGTLFSILIRLELYNTGTRLICVENQNYYNLIFTLHGLVMIFFNVQPALFGGFGNYYVPVFCGSAEVAFPRINSVSLMLLPLAFLFALYSSLTEFGFGPGWTMYPPLSTTANLCPTSLDLLLIGLVLVGFSSYLSSINFVTTIGQLRTPGFGLGALSFNSWAIVFTAFMLIATLPILTSALLMLLSDAHFNTIFFEPAFAGDPVLYQHLFWFFGHPEVYILIIPGFAIISQVLSLSYSRLVFGTHSMVLAMGCISVLGGLVWVHHMMTVGLEADTRAYFTAVTILISLPTGTKIFNWISTYMSAQLNSISQCGVLYTLSFVFTFTLGGTTGVVLGNAAVDVALHDTYYVVAHFHFVLSLGAVLSIMAGLSWLQASMFGYTLVLNSIGMVFALIFGVGILLIFIPMHLLGFGVMPRRIMDYSDVLFSWNQLCSIGSLLIAFGTALLFT